MFPNYYARKVAAGVAVPLIISPRGMLEEWSLGRSRLKKSVVWRLFERDNLASAKLFHATGEPEAESLRAAGLRQPIAIIPNGIDLPDAQAAPSRTRLEAKHPELAGKSWMLFLSRLHEKKGIIELLRAWGELKERFPDWQLVLAGPDLDGYGRRARETASQLGLGSRVTFTGMLSGDDKSCVLWNSGLFVLPTHSENFGLAVAEALAHRVPVVTTKGAPWRVLTENECGWWIDMDERALAAALEAAMRIPADKRREMGMRGRALVERRYSWGSVGEEMSAVYHWLTGHGGRPACVHLA
jgi:glycosyltransferase involved in cell wall biosynthesis